MFGTIPTVEKDPEKVRVYMLDLATRQLSVVPESQGLYMPAWSPDGRYVAALTALNSFRVFDFRKSRWLPQTRETANFLLWTKDSSGILFIDHQDEAGPSVNLYDVSTATTTRLQTLPGFKQFSSWIGTDPDGALLISRDLSTQEIYQITLDDSRH
jgi:Tol biopolymer transport system component